MSDKSLLDQYYTKPEVASWTAGVRSITLKELAYVLDRRDIRD